MNYEKYREKVELLNILIDRKEKVIYRVNELLGENQGYETIKNLNQELMGLNMLINRVNRDIEKTYR